MYYLSQPKVSGALPGGFYEDKHEFGLWIGSKGLHGSPGTGVPTMFSKGLPGSGRLSGQIGQFQNQK